jgi:hypothetical protein
MDTRRALAVATAVLGIAPGCTASSAGTTAGRAAAPPMHVGCDQIIDRTTRPFAGGYRRVLGVIAAPPPYIPQVVRNDDEHWPYWEKSGMVIHAGPEPVVVRIPARWQERAAITWGNGLPPAHAIRFAACPSPPGVWNAYAGGFLLKSRGACLPLVFEVGRERRVVQVGIHVRCGGT